MNMYHDYSMREHRSKERRTVGEMLDYFPKQNFDVGLTTYGVYESGKSVQAFAVLTRTGEPLLVVLNPFVPEAEPEYRPLMPDAKPTEIFRIVDNIANGFYGRWLHEILMEASFIPEG